MKQINCGSSRQTVKLILILLLLVSCQRDISRIDNEKFVSFFADPQSLNVDFFWKDDDGKIFKSIGNLEIHLEKTGKRLRFAMNGGIFDPQNQPKGLFIQNKKVMTPIDTKDGDGNFYLQPNGIFYLTTDNQPFVVPTENFDQNEKVKFATQSGPMLLINGKINDKFQENSANLNVRNGVGILPDGKIAFVISRQETNFYEFARYFQNLGCHEALYLDGFVSRMYLPEKNFEQLDGDFAVIIGVTE